MSRLYRPHIPIEVRCRVILRQIGEMWPGRVINDHRTMPGGLGQLLKSRLELFADITRCEVADFRLDHDPPLGARPKRLSTVLGHDVYTPDANDPDHLFYRPHGAQFEGSHDVKTRIRGDHGQFSDIALIKRQRRRERVPKPKRPFASVSRSKLRRTKRKQKIPSRPFPKRRKK
jgi:hypothetical protein